LILYANAHFAWMVERPLAQIVGSSFYDLLPASIEQAATPIEARESERRRDG
jgi:hypothetical protein